MANIAGFNDIKKNNQGGTNQRLGDHGSGSGSGNSFGSYSDMVNGQAMTFEHLRLA